MMINNNLSSSVNTMILTPMPQKQPKSTSVTTVTVSASALPDMPATPLITATMSTEATTKLTTPTTAPIAPTAPTACQPQSQRIEKPERNLWREQEMLTVLQIIREKKLLPLLNDKTIRSEAVFRKVEKEMFDRGYRKKNFQQIWTKWKFLKSTYMTSRRMHQIPKIIPLDVYESLDELLSVEFQNDGSMSSYDGGDYEDGGGSGSVNTNGGCGVASGGGGKYEMMSASASTTTGSNDGYLPIITNVQGSNLPLATALSQSSSSLTMPLSLSSSSTPLTSAANVLFNGTARNYAATDLENGFGAIRSRNKFKNGFRSSFKNEDETNGFGMQHPIFGYRLGVVKDEPIDDEYENSNNTIGENETDTSYPTADVVHTEENPSICEQYPDIKPELSSPPPSPSSSPSGSTTPHDEDHLPVPVIQTMSHSPHPMEVGEATFDDPHMPPLHRYTPPYRKPSESQHPPPLKQIPFAKIQLPPKPHIPTQINQLHFSKVESSSNISPAQFNSNSKKIPVLTLRKRKKRLNIPDLSEGTESQAPSSKISKNSDEDDSRESPPETSRIPFVTYGKAMREMSSSLRDIQREMIDDFFKQQMDLAKSEHEFQKQQDAILLRCFEDQTKLLLEGARRLFAECNNKNTKVPLSEDGE